MSRRPEPSWTETLGMDEVARADRLDFLGIGPHDFELLAELETLLAPHLESLVGRWHEFLAAHPKTRDLLPTGQLGEHLRAMQTHYFRTLLRGTLDLEYFEDRLRIGFVHERVGLEPAWYMGAYRMFQDMVRALLLRKGQSLQRVTSWLSALEKIIYLDMELALDAYFYARNQAVMEANASLGRVTSELDRRNRELSVQFRRAQEAARLKDELLSKVSHEVRTPLSAIQGFADLLADGIEGPITDRQEGSLRKIRQHGERVLQIFEQMIGAARLAAEGGAAPRPFDPMPVIENAVNRARARAQDKGLAFSVRVERELPWVWGDREGLALALECVLDNACKFTRTGEIVLGANRINAGVRIEVRDTGPGIPAEHRERIFEPFHQVESGDTRAVSGVGMGLALARQAMGRMGGTIKLGTTGPGGSTFLLDLLEPPPDRGSPVVEDQATSFTQEGE